MGFTGTGGSDGVDSDRGAAGVAFGSSVAVAVSVGAGGAESSMIGVLIGRGHHQRGLLVTYRLPPVP